MPPRALEREGTLLAQLASLTTPDSYDTTYLTHGIHPYPAKYIPQLPNLIIREHTNERNTVFDPFCGSGTTLLEAAILGRKSLGIDSNPVATLVASAKTTALNNEELLELEKFVDRVREFKVPKRKPNIRGAKELNLDHWFQENVIAELFVLRSEIEQIAHENVRTFLTCILSSIIVSVSNQESETRYAAKEKHLQAGDTFKRFNAKLKRELPKIRELSSLKSVQRNRPRILKGDVRILDSFGVKENTVDLIVTSPPYPNSFDYYLYHKWRLFWTGADYRTVMAAEIGSRNEHSSRKQPIDAYVTKMREAMVQMARLLKPSKLAYFFVGDAVIGGTLFNIADVFQEIIEGTNFKLVADTNYSLEAVTRSFHEKKSSNCHGGRRNMRKLQHVLVFEKANRAKRITPPNRTKATAVSAATPVSLLTDSVESGQVVSLKSADNIRHIHSLGRYPSKFIPEIPRWAISNFSERFSVVCDPFSGSGTTAVEAITHSRNAIASDVSPYSCLLTRAKTCLVDPDSLIATAHDFRQSLARGLRQHDAESMSFPLADFWFPQIHLEQLAKCKRYIEESVAPELRDFMLAVLSTVIRPCSYQDEGQIKVKRDPKKVLHGTPSPFELLPNALEKAVQRKLEFLKVADSSCMTSVFEASADSLVSDGLVTAGSVDLIVTSPPYVNAMNYPMTHRYENIVLGLIAAAKKNEHERAYFGSERVYAKEYSRLHKFANTFDRSSEVNRILAEIFKGEPKRSFVTYRFFALMNKSIQDFAQLLKPGGNLVLVVGRNRIKGVPVDTFGILVSMLEASGLKPKTSFEYEIIKNAFKLTRNATADIIKTDGVAVLEKDE